MRKSQNTPSKSQFVNDLRCNYHQSLAVESRFDERPKFQFQLDTIIRSRAILITDSDRQTDRESETDRQTERVRQTDRPISQKYFLIQETLKHMDLVKG